MFRDVFYYGKKPNVHPREKFASSLEDARSQATTEHFWIINEFCDYKGFDWDFDFEFLPDEDVWTEQHNNVWPSQHQKDSGTWLCNTYNKTPATVYRADVDPIKRKNEKNNKWVIVDVIDETKFDFSWHPDPTDPPYIYIFPTNWNQVGGPEYHVDGATEKKYITTQIGVTVSQKDKWVISDNVDVSNFDFSWVPHPDSPAYIYEFGTQWQKTGGPKYIVEGATEVKFIDTLRVTALVNMSKWSLPTNVDISDFDFSWHPDATSPPYIYRFPTQWAMSGGPVYTVEGATEVKYVEDMVAKAIADPERKNWEVPAFIDIDSFDFSWHPYAEDEPFIYQFGTQWQKTGGPRFLTPGVHKNSPVKYIDTRITKATRLPSRKNFATLNNLKIDNFDYTWHPDTTEEPFIYVFGNQHYSGEIMPTIEYVVPGAKQIKYVNDIIATLAPDKTNWVIIQDIVEDKFDFSWKPNPKDPPYIYVWGNKFIEATLQSTIEYHVEGATEKKYMTALVEVKPELDRWDIPNDSDISEFDLSWRPDPREPDFIYQFGTQWQKTGGPRYTAPGATEIKYIDTQKAKALPSKKNWILPDKIQIDDFDYSWHPDATEQPYIYQFGTQWQLTGGPKYVSPESIGTKYIDPSELHAKAAVTMSCWEIPVDIDRNNFDFSWHPHPDDPDFIYQFGTQHQKTGGPRYVPNVPDSEMLPTKYIDTRILKAIRKPSRIHWEVSADVSVTKFDFSWHPDDTDPKYIVQFGTIMNENDGPRYVPIDNTGKVIYKVRVELKEDVNLIDVPKYYITTTLEDLVNQHNNETFWALRENIEYTNFDFTWRPQIVDIAWESNYVHVFGSTESEITQTYFINASSYLKGNKDFKFVETKQLDNTTLTGLFKKPSMFLVDRGNSETAKRFEQLKARFPDIQKTRYLNTWVDTISRCINRSSTELCWILDSELDYADFNFDYYPNPWQMKMIHVFGTQWSHWGTTFIVNRDSFVNDTKYVKIIEHLSILNFVKDQDKRAKATSCLYDIFVVDHGNKEMFKVFRSIQSKANDKSVTNVEYKENYLDTFKEILNQLPEKKEQYIWICSSLCDYSQFDFTYICDPFAREQLHVFPSDKQKYGDTFLVNVNKLRELITEMSTLQDYEKINFNRHMSTHRYPAPEVISDSDTHTGSLDIRFDYPYVVLVSEDNKDIEKVDYDPINLWSSDTKNIIITSSGGTRIVVPKEAKDIIKNELYDYPNIVKTNRLAKSKPLDIVFLSNGEPGADENYEHLLNVTRGLSNKIVRVEGVNGRVAAYHAAAEASETPWMFTVFAKLKVSNKFDWNWQPDRLQVPKHYVFHAKNPVNGLVYGHQAMIAYNKKMTLANLGRGLDFTQDDVHEVVEINSGVANFNVDKWTTWRTAFRECIKLCTFADEVSQERLKVWTTIASGDYAQHCLAGANDAVEYFDEVAGDFDQLKLSYDWAWLKDRFDKKLQ